jgi:hypothetical protein
VATPAAPGAGKTRFISLVASRGLSAVGGSQCRDAEWEAALDELGDPIFRAAIESSVGVTVTFNHTTSPCLHEPIDTSLVRGQTDYEAFLGRFEGPRPSPAEALAVIRLDIDTNYPLPTSADRRHIILVVDELLAATDDLRGRADIVSSLGVIIDGNTDVHVAVTSLSEDKLQATVGPSMRAVIVIVLPPLTATSVNELISILSCELQVGLGTSVFRIIVLECVGVPRLFEMVCKIVPMCGTTPTLQGVRGLVAADEMVVAKQNYGEKCYQAVLSTFSAWRYSSTLAVYNSEQRLDALMMNGYVYRIWGRPKTAAR